jgi:hypothetical protein
MSRRWPVIVTAFVLCAFLVLALTFTVSAWTRFEARISVHGWIALILGVVLSIVVGCGLMALMFFSHRRGYDDAVARDEGEE